MRIGKQSKAPALLSACGILFAGLLLGPSFLQAGQTSTTSGHENGANASAFADPEMAGFVHTSRRSTQSSIDAIVNRVSDFYQVDPKLIHAMIRVESDYDPSGIPAVPETEHYVQEVTHSYHPREAGSGTLAGPAASGIRPIVRYVDSKGVVHFTNVE